MPERGGFVRALAPGSRCIEEMSERGFVRGAIAAGSAALLLVGAGESRAHDLAMDQLILMPDRAHGVLRGQVTFNPHRSREAGKPAAPELEARVVSLLDRELTVEVDGEPCPLRYTVRELWVPAGATLGDVVDVHCPLRAAARSLEVIVSPSIGAFVVTVQTAAHDGAPLSHSVLLSAGGATPAYRFSEPSSGWSLGGAEQFQSAPTQPSARLPAPPRSEAGPSPAPEPRSRASFVLGVLLAPVSFLVALLALRSRAKAG